MTVRLPNPGLLSSSSARLGLSRNRTAALALEALHASQAGAYRRIRTSVTTPALASACTAAARVKPSQRTTWSMLADLESAPLESTRADAAHFKKRLHPVDILLVQLWALRWANAPDAAAAKDIWEQLAHAGPPLQLEGASTPDPRPPAPRWPPLP